MRFLRAAVDRGLFSAIGLLISLSACSSLSDKAYRSGVSAYARGDLEAATYNLSRFVVQECYLESGDPRCHEAELELARAYCREGRPAWSLPVYDKMLVWQTSAEALALKRETDEARAALEAALARSRSTVPTEIRFRHDAASSFRIMYGMLFVDGVKVFDSRQHVPEIDMAAGWIPLFSQSLPDGEHALVFKVAFVSRPANATPTPYLLTRSRVFGGRGKPVSLDLISTALPGTVIHYGSMAVAVGLRSSTHSERSDAEELDAPALSP